MRRRLHSSLRAFSSKGLLAPSALLVAASLVGCTTRGAPIDGEGEGEAAAEGEGEGNVVVSEGEGEGTVVVGEGEGEGSIVGAEGEGEGVVAEGEGEGSAVDPDAPVPGGPIDVGAASLLQGYTTRAPSSSTGACSTAQWWFLGDIKSERMHPGGDCIQCHSDRGEGPRYTVAGTVHGAATDELNCRGVPDVTVDILNGTGAVAFSMTTNYAGNFFSNQALPAAYTVRLSYQGRTREMGSSQSDGACNRCHDAVGVDGAPGRIVVP